MNDAPEDTTKWRKNKDAFAAQVSRVWVSVKGFEPNTSVDQLCSFLESKCRSTLTFLEKVQENGAVLLRLESPTQSFHIQKLSGIRMGAGKLQIRSIRRDQESTEVEMKGGSLLNLMMSFVESTYNKAGKFLNLSNLGGREQAGIRFDFNNHSFMRTLFTAIGAKCGDVETLSFANDQIHSLAPFQQMTKFVNNPTVNLSFENNLVDDFNQLDHLKGLKLRELDFKGNPIKANHPEDKYQSEFSRRFSTLKYLDGHKLSSFDFGLPNYLTSGQLPPNLGDLFDSPQTKQVAEIFLKKFYQIFDGDNKNGLLDAYTDHSYFSMSSSISLKQANKPTKQAQDAWHLIKSSSRNLLHVKDLDRRTQLLKVGRIDIIHFLNSLPVGRLGWEDIRIDAFMLPPIGAAQVLSINIHGYYWEVAASVNRSFDRTMLLTPAPPNSPAAQQGWPAVILNDHLHIHNYAGKLPPVSQDQPVAASAAPQVNLQPQPTQPPFSTALPLNPTLSMQPPNAILPTPNLTVLPTHSPQATHSDLLQKLIQETKLKPQFAQQCLEQNSWNYEQSLEAVRTLQARNQIPAHMLQT